MYAEEIGKMVWSYSRLSAFAQCRYQFYLRYIVDDDDQYLSEGNYYAELGTYVHSILEKLFKGEISVDDAAQYFVDHYDDHVLYQTRQSIMDKSFEACANYFAELDLKWLDDFEVVGVEQKIETEIDGRPFTGFIDLLLRKRDTGAYYIIDHKSAKYPLSKRTGKPLKVNEASFTSYKRQMYLYCKWVRETYGAFPEAIIWNHFKEQDYVKIPFDAKEYEEALAWFTETIHQVENEETFPETQDFFYCHNLCEYRHSCEMNMVGEE